MGRVGRRATRSDGPADPAATLRALRACRDAMVEVCGRVKPMGPVYHGASMVMAAIDGFAALLTGERYYFHATGSAPGDARRPGGTTRPPDPGQPGPAQPDPGRDDPDAP